MKKKKSKIFFTIAIIIKIIIKIIVQYFVYLWENVRLWHFYDYLTILSPSFFWWVKLSSYDVVGWV
jgi:hypothetical protein